MLKTFMASIGVEEKASKGCVSTCRSSIFCLIMKKDAQVLMCNDGSVKTTGNCC